jgi:hypothetical protein
MSAIVSLALRLIWGGLSSHPRIIQVADGLFKNGGISKLKISHSVTGWLANTDLDFLEAEEYQPPESDRSVGEDLHRNN